MQTKLLFKTLIVFGLMLLISIPLIMISSTIAERSAFRAEAVSSIAADSVREQTVIGPVLVLPYTDEYDEPVEVETAGVKKTEIQHHSNNRRFLVFPNELKIAGSIETDRRYRGIHQVLVYSGTHAVSGDFVLPTINELPRSKGSSRLTLGQPFVSLAIDDVRGIRNIPKLNWAGQPVEFEQGPGLTAFKSGLHAPLGAMALAEPQLVAFQFDLGLDGIERQSFVPLGKNNQVNIKSNWPHPQFSGRFLPSPKQRVINEHGFNVSWAISSLATNAQQQLRTLDQGSVDAVRTEAGMQSVDMFSVGFIEPINIYSQADRATKYGLLFVALTFAAFFIFEIMKRLPIHPVQYLLVGLALILFFLLLLALSEHVAFLSAYLIASAACIVLIGFYLAQVLGNWRRGMGFGVALTLLYGALYGLLSSENMALVLGSLLLFAVLAAIMVATRKVDWYQVGKVEAEPVQAA